MDEKMSGLSERDVERLADLICADTDEPMWSAFVIAKHIGSSDWLAERDAAIRDKAKAEALAPIRALADEWQANAAANERAGHFPWAMWQNRANDLRALLDGGDQS